MRTSTITMSGSTRRATSIADAPSADSPTTSKPGVSATIARAASRKSTWSSTVMIRTVGCEGSGVVDASTVTNPPTGARPLQYGTPPLYGEASLPDADTSTETAPG